jgi:hypothetical protein
LFIVISHSLGLFTAKAQRAQRKLFFSFAFNLPSSCKGRDYGTAGRKANEKQPVTYFLIMLPGKSGHLTYTV